MIPDTRAPTAPPRTIATGQKVAIAAWILGTGAFFTTLGHILHTHMDWYEFGCPPGVGDLCYVVASATLAVGGAFGISPRQLLRQWTGSYNSRAGE